jgi:flagellar biosynthesis chaperone FliJ
VWSPGVKENAGSSANGHASHDGSGSSSKKKRSLSELDGKGQSPNETKRQHVNPQEPGLPAAVDPVGADGMLPDSAVSGQAVTATEASQCSGSQRSGSVDSNAPSVSSLDGADLAKLLQKFESSWQIVCSHDYSEGDTLRATLPPELVIKIVAARQDAPGFVKDLDMCHGILLKSVRDIEDGAARRRRAGKEAIRDLEARCQTALSKIDQRLQLPDGCTTPEAVLGHLRQNFNASDAGRLEQTLRARETDRAAKQGFLEKLQEGLSAADSPAAIAGYISQVAPIVDQLRQDVQEQDAALEELRSRRDTAQSAMEALQVLEPSVAELRNQRDIAKRADSSLSHHLADALKYWNEIRRRLYEASVACPAARATFLLYDTRCTLHRVPDSHMEKAERMLEATAAMTELATRHPDHFALEKSIQGQYFPLRSEEGQYITPILRTHAVDYLDYIWDKCHDAGSQITRFSAPADEGGKGAKDKEDGDTFGNKDSVVAASVGFAAALQAVDKVLGGEARNAFVACRPPGHHARRDMRPQVDAGGVTGWGFCFLNYVAGAAKHAVEHWGLERACVIDFDLHHGELMPPPRAAAWSGLHALTHVMSPGGVCTQATARRRS